MIVIHSSGSKHSILASSLDIDEETPRVQKLETGDTLPEIRLQLVGGGTLTLPADIDADFGVALFYRGYW